MCQVKQLSHVGHVVQIGEVRFRLFGTSGFHVMQRIRDLLPYLRVVVRTSNIEFSRRLTDYIKIARKSVPHVQHDYFPRSANQIIDLWRCCCRCCRPFLNSQLQLTKSNHNGLLNWKILQHAEMLFKWVGNFKCGRRGTEESIGAQFTR